MVAGWRVVALVFLFFFPRWLRWAYIFALRAGE